MFHLYCPINDSIQSGVLDESKEYCIFAEKVNGERSFWAIQGTC